MGNSAPLVGIACLVLVGCMVPIASEPVVIGEPTPGSFHLASEPQTARQSLTIRVDDGTPSGWSEEVPEGAPVWVFFTTLPDDNLRIWVNGLTCDGNFAVKARFETDLLLTMTGSNCAVRVLGIHPEGAVDHKYVPASAEPSGR